MSDERRVAELLAVWEQRRESGRDVTAAELCQDCPHLLDTLSREIASRQSGGQTTGPDDTGSDSLPPAEAFALARYRPFRFHARGGLGEVFVARDAELGRDVALKRIRPTKADQKDLRERFRREAEITGRLEHPGIVPVYGLGHDSADQPYYAMRFVEGETFLDAIDAFYKADAGRDPGERSLAFRQLLQRFGAVCQALAYAHNRGILHRDVKPANVMLGRYGETLVVDWGLARPFERGEVERSSGEETLAPDSGGSGTQLGAALGTPAYMSPEQAAGMWDELGPASDVYSLGATLYHLLTGKVAFEGKHVRELLQKVQRGMFPRPRTVRPTVPPALEAVCLKAMALEPGDRYPSALDLAADVNRWLADEPVAAYPEPRTARAWRWVRRHRGAVVAAVAGLAATAVLAVVAAVVLTAANERERQATALALENEQEARRLKDEAERQRDEAKRQRDRAEQNFRLAREAVDKYFTQVSQSKLFDKAGLQPLRKELLQTALEFYQRFVKDRADDPDPALQSDLGGAYYRLATITAEIESATKAVPLYRAAAAVHERLAAAHPADPAHRHAAAWCHNDLGIVLRDFDTAAALQAHEAARAHWTALARTAPDDPVSLSALGASLNNIGTLHYDRGQLAEAEALFREAIDRQTKAVALRTRVGQYRKFLSIHYACLGDTLAKRGRPADALRAHQEAAAVRTALVNEFPGVVDYRYLLAASASAIGNLKDDLRDQTGAILALGLARTNLETLTRANPDVIDYASTLATVRIRLADLYRRTGRLAEAETAAVAAVATLADLSAKHSQSTTYLNDLAWGRTVLGLAHRDAKRPDRAEATFRQALETRERLARDYPDIPLYQSNLAISHTNLGMLLRDAGRSAEAEAAYRQAVAIRERLTRAYPATPEYLTDLAQTYHNLGLLLSDRGKPDQAIVEYRSALTLRLGLVRDHPGQLGHWYDLAWTCNNLGLKYDDTASRSAAVVSHLAALAVRAGLVWRRPADTDYLSECGLSLMNLGDQFNHLDMPTAAVGVNTLSIALQQSVVRRAPKDENAPVRLSSAHWGRADALARLDRDEEAVPDWELAVKTAAPANRAFLHMRLAISLSRCERHDRAVDAAEASVKEPNAAGLTFFNAACVLAVAASAADEAVGPDAVRRDRLGERRAARAVELLDKARRADYFKVPENFEHLQTDADLDGLRERDDFRRFIASLAPSPRP
jgi:serine/threonine-protein kinase